MKALATAMGLLAAVPAYAETTPWSVRPEPGLVCMVAIKPPVVVLPSPQPGATPIGSSNGIVFARSPTRIVNGFLEIEDTARGVGWVPRDAVAPFSEPCVPMLQSNGRLSLGG
jgi:hypothetical protein